MPYLNNLRVALSASALGQDADELWTVAPEMTLGSRPMASSTHMCRPRLARSAAWAQPANGWVCVTCWLTYAPWVGLSTSTVAWKL